MKAWWVAAAAVAVAAVRGQGFSSSGNDYPVEDAKENGPMSQEVAFTGRGNPTEGLDDANLVVGIISPTRNFKQRASVRASWVQLQSMHDPKLNRLAPTVKRNMAVRFVVGDSSEDAEISSALDVEMEKYNDIVRVTIPFGEGYRKAGEFLKWTHSTYNYQWVFLTKDDSFVRLDKLYGYMEQLGTEKVYVGKVIADRPVSRILDSRTPFSMYPPFVSTAGIGLSRDLVDIAVNNLPQLSYPIAEDNGYDVAIGNWFSGMTITPINNDRFHIGHDGCDKEMLVQGLVEPAEMKETFINTVKGVPCHGNPFKKIVNQAERDSALSSNEAASQVLLSTEEVREDDGGDDEEGDGYFAREMNSNGRQDDDAMATQMNFDLKRVGNEGIVVDDMLLKKNFDMN